MHYTGLNYLIKIIRWIFCVIASIKLLVEKTISSLVFVHWPKTHILTMDDTTPSTSQKENLPQLCNRQLRAPVFSRGLQMWIRHLLVH